METKKQKNEELQSRREFFKEAAKKALPLFAVAALGTSLLSSCEKELFGSNGCSCSGSCSGSCDSGCTNNCDSLCGGDCYAYCQSVAKY